MSSRTTRKRKTIKKTMPEACRDLIAAYCKAKGTTEYSAIAVARWALETGQAAPRRRDPGKELAKDISKIANALHHRDKQQRLVKTMHAAKYERILPGGQKTFEIIWDHLDTMSDDHATVSFEQRYRQVVGHANSLRTDMDSFYENNPNAGERRQLSFNLDLLVEPAQEQEVCVVPITQPKPKPR